MDQPAMITERLSALGDVTERGFHFRSLREDATELSWAELVSEVARAASALRESGVRRADRVALLAVDPGEFVPLVLAILWAGAVAVPIAPPSSVRQLSSYSQSLTATLTQAHVRLLVVADELLPVVAGAALPGGCLGVLSAEELLLAGAPGMDRVAVVADDLCLVQFTSGSTRRPRGVRVTHGQLMACITVGVEAVRSDHTGVGVSWLPLYHDMGLIGSVLGPVQVGSTNCLSTPVGFLRDPLSWLRQVDAVRATFTVAPPFALALTLRRLAALPEPPAWDLSSLTRLALGGEPLPAATLLEFRDTMAAFGLRSTALAPAYGSAEATLSMTVAAFKELRVDEVDPGDLTSGLATATAGGRPFIGCGVVMPGSELRVVSSAGEVLADRRVGHVIFRGPSVSAGYFEDAEASAEVFRDGWLWTGDLGYLVEGELFITGRSKDLLILNGRNQDPQALEWAAERVEGVRPGGVAAFSVPGEETELVVLVLESKSRPADLVERVRRAVQGELQVPVSDVVLLAPGELPKTTSGKVQRRKVREAYLAGTLGLI